MGEIDSAFKTLVQLAPQEFVSRFLPGAVYVKTLSIELPRDPIRADWLCIIRFPGSDKEYIFHIEEQSDADATIGQRMCQYAIAAYLREKHEVISIVIYLHKCATVTSPWIMEGPNGPILTYNFQVVRLWEESVDEWLNADSIALIPFVPLLKGATVDVIEPAMQKLEAIPGAIERGNIVNYLLFFASRAFDAATLIKYLEEHHMLTEKYIVESPWYQYILRQGEEAGQKRGEEIGIQLGQKRGEEIGRKQGEEIGRKQGEEIGLRDAILTLASRRFPALEAEIAEHIAQITDLARLQEFVLLIGTAPDEVPVRQALTEPTDQDA
jgi:predicted transposase YdaD